MIYTKETLEPRHLYYYPDDFDAGSKERLAEAFDELEKAVIQTPRDLLSLLYQLSELMSIVNQESNRLHYMQYRDTSDLEIREKMQEFMTGISDFAEERSLKIIKMYYEHPLREQLNQDYFKQINLTFESIFASSSTNTLELQNEERRLLGLYRDKVNQLQFEFEGVLYYFKDSNLLFSDPDPLRRSAIWNARKDAFQAVKGELHEVFDAIIKLRHQQAQKAGFEHYYDFDQRFNMDSSLNHKQLRDTLASLKKQLPPLLQTIYAQWKKHLKLKVLAPSDCVVNPEHDLLKPFHNEEELVSKGIRILYDIRFEYGLLLDKMWNTGLLDLEYKSEKAAGQFYFADSHYGTCRIMMNCRGTHDDMMMFFHEIGHVLQFSMLMKNPLYTYLILPVNLREIASQAMVYLSMGAWVDFYPESKIRKTAIRYQYSDDLIRLCQSAACSSFELEIYANPEHSLEQRESAFRNIYKSYFPFFEDADYDGYLSSIWLLKMGVFEYPFYDIYTTLSLFAVWQIIRNFAKDKEDTMLRFHKFLSKSAENNAKQLYDILGLKHDFSDATLKKILEIVKKNLKA